MVGTLGAWEIFWFGWLPNDDKTGFLIRSGFWSKPAGALLPEPSKTLPILISPST
ncbi:hypothetical protein TGAMA5MH_01792 [Trichoderma gamsii]|uniref:Uncharacterized protein n=1 Tax=Trichoderma gamsii TaxID=398673 RepID=A0A2K0TMT8_9HYPO|nr:hypothetical protein TGAMA5MH_01792 [Trichoderma gamsii]